MARTFATGVFLAAALILAYFSAAGGWAVS